MHESLLSMVPRPLARGAGSGEVPISCSAVLAVWEPVPKALAARASLSPREWGEGAPGMWGPCCALGTTSGLGRVQGPGTAQRSSTAHSIRHNPNLGTVAVARVGRGREGS